ncbi:MAG: LysR family transcriptional regulator [Clostridia bacterium]|nr:LysR family transcriptional regulator [Clostridia bacterium]
MVNLDLYRVFYTVAKCGSLTKAAEELYISQPAVSQAIKQLETGLGGKLFNRTHKGMELSEGGKKIFSTVEEALNLLSTAEAVYTEYSNTATGSLKICVSDTVCNAFLMPILKEYHTNYPNVKLQLINCTSSETVELLKNNKADVGFINLPAPDKDIKVLNVVMPLHDGFFCGEKFFGLTNEVLPLGKLQDYPLLMLESPTVTAKAVLNFASSQGVQLVPEIELGSLELMTELAVKNMGIACVPQEFVKKQVELGLLKEVVTEPSLPVRAIGMALPKSAEMTFAVKEFIKAVNV